MTYLTLRRLAVVWLVVLPLLVLAGDGKKPPLRFAAAEKIIFPETDVTEGWGSHQVARGGIAVGYIERQRYDELGYRTGSDWTRYSSNHTGSVIAVPVGDFVPVYAFEHLGSDGYSCCTGLVVSVDIQISSGSKSPSEMAMHQSVKNLVNSGMAVPATNGGKAGHLMSLKRSGARRFGAKNVRPHYDAVGGKVYLLMEDCDPEKADPTYVPGTPDNLSRQERARLNPLHRDEDKGGATVFWAISELHPIGSRYLNR